MDIEVAGQTFTLETTINGYYVGAHTAAGSESVDYGASPTVLVFDPPIGPIENIDLGEVYIEIKRQLGI